MGMYDDLIPDKPKSGGGMYDDLIPKKEEKQKIR